MTIEEYIELLLISERDRSYEDQPRLYLEAEQYYCLEGEPQAKNKEQDKRVIIIDL